MSIRVIAMAALLSCIAREVVCERPVRGSLGATKRVQIASTVKLETSVTDYEVIRFLKEGAFGKAFLVQNGGQNYVWKKPKCLDKKLVKLSGCTAAQELAKGFQIMKTLQNCPNVVGVIAGPNEFSITWTEKGWTKQKQIAGYLMPYYTGGDLEQYLESELKRIGKLDYAVWKEHYTTFKTEFEAGMECMHQLKIAHLDMKMDNVFVQDVGGVGHYFIADLDKGGEKPDVKTATQADLSKQNAVIDQYFESLPKVCKQHFNRNLDS